MKQYTQYEDTFVVLFSIFWHFIDLWIYQQQHTDADLTIIIYVKYTSMQCPNKCLLIGPFFRRKPTKFKVTDWFLKKKKTKNNNPGRTKKNMRVYCSTSEQE